MIRKIFNFLVQNKKQISRYFLTGVSGFLLDIALLYLLKQVFGFSSTVSVVINQIIVLTYIFLMHKFFSFQKKGGSQQQVFRFLVVMGINYLLAVGLMWIFAEKIGFNYLLVRTANIALSITWNFILYRKWVYKSYPHPTP
jgi:putative flippase GtrA